MVELAQLTPNHVSGWDVKHPGTDGDTPIDWLTLMLYGEDAPGHVILNDAERFTLAVRLLYSVNVAGIFEYHGEYLPVENREIPAEIFGVATNGIH